MIFFNLFSREISKAKVRLNTYQNRFTDHFKTTTRTVNNQAKKYLHGKLIVQKRGTMTEIANVVPDCNNQSIQHFISNSQWDEQGLIYHIQDDVAKLIGDKENGSLQLDESGFPKQGNNSVGVQRQYCGRLGKVENCQVGVFLGYVNDDKRLLIDKRLYIPKKWMNSPICRKSCGIPEYLAFKTKAELGLEMIMDAKNRNIPFGYVGMDTFYGQQSWLLNELEKENIVYIADIPCDTLVWLNKPEMGIPPKKGKRGRKPKNIKVIGNEKPIRVDKFAQELDSSQYHRIFVRDSERKNIWCELTCLRVYSTDNSLPSNERWLIIRRTEGEKKIKYQFSNAPLETSLEKFGKMSYSRYWIERAIEDAKSDLGLADYEVRGYLGWNHHMAMTILAMLFLMEMQDEWLSDAPLLTLTDVREILIEIMPRRKLGPNEILNLIEQKHKARHSAKRSHHKRSG